MTLLRGPVLNKGTAFTELEREVLGLRERLAPAACARFAERYFQIAQLLLAHLFGAGLVMLDLSR